MNDAKDVLVARETQFFRADGDSIDSYMPEIQRLAQRDVKPDEVIVRGMMLANDQRDTYFSRFTESGLHEIAELLPGRPVMVGHNIERLPVARFFRGDVVKSTLGAPRGKMATWVRALFYMPNDEVGQAITRRMDLGVYRDASAGWKCTGTECSLDGENIRSCGHTPGEVYERGLCEFRFSGVTRMLEGSLVYSGAQRGTTTFIPDSVRRSEESFDEKEVMLWTRVADAIREHRSADNEIDALLRYGQPDPPLRQRVSHLTFDSGLYEAREAATWCRNNSFRADRMEVRGQEFVFAQRDIDLSNGSRRISLDDGVSAVAAEMGRSRRFENVESILRS